MMYMKQKVTVYTNKKTGKKFELIPEITFEGKTCLEDMETGEQKFYAASTLKRNFYKEEVEKEIEVPSANEQEPALRANLIRSDVNGEGVQIKETQSYIGIAYGKKSAAQIAFTKKRLTVSVNKEEFFYYLESFEDRPEVLELVDKCFYKEAPAKYGWRMDMEIDVTDLTNKEIVEIINTAVDARRYVVK